MKYFLSGGAGFIGSHTAENLLKDKKNKVIIYDNLSSGTKNHISFLLKKKNLKFIKADLKNKNKLIKSMKNVDCVIHFAANPDIAKAVRKPDIDFWEGTYLTQNLLEGMRLNKVPFIIYTSGSGVYGENPKIKFKEDYGPCIPISTYGASKLACESLISSYCFMFGLKARVFRFANVVGPKQTHGVGYDFIKKLKKNPKKLKILGNGTQLKSYIHVKDVISAIKIGLKQLRGKHKLIYDVYNVSTDDNITVTDIAKCVCKIMKLKKVKLIYGGGDRGWKGDVPLIKFNNNKLKKIGWRYNYSSRRAIILSLKSLLTYIIK